MAIKKPKPKGPATMFRGKVPKPVTLTLTQAHHVKVKRNTQRLDLSRADLISLLIDKFADTVTTDYPSAYKRLRDAAAALGGSLEHVKRNEPPGGSWVLTLGNKRLRMPSTQSRRYPPLDACYALKEGVAVAETWEDNTKEIDPAGVAKLFELLAAQDDDSHIAAQANTSPRPE